VARSELPGDRLIVRARWLWWVGGLLAALAVALVLTTAVVLVRMRGVLAGQSEQLLAAVGRAIGLPVDAAAVDVSWWPPGVTAQDVEIPDHSPYGPGDLARIDEARIEVALLPLLRGEVVVNEVRLIAPVLFVVRGVDGGWNIGATPERAVPPRADVGGPSIGGPAVVIDAVRVRNARVVYRDRAIPGLGELEVKAINALLRRRGDVYRATFNAQALGGPEENVEGSMIIPAAGAASAAATAAPQATLHLRASELGGARLPELIALLRGTMPFGIALDGSIAGTIDVELPAAWPPTRAAARLVLDVGAASLNGAGGWVEKPAGRPLDVQLDLRTGPFGVAVDRAAVSSGEVRLVANLADPPVPGPDAGQQPLLLALEGFDAERLATWMPALATAQPRGSLFLEGRLTPGPDGVATDLRVATSQLAVQQSGSEIAVASASLDLSVAPGSNGVLGALRVAEVRSADGTIGALTATVAGAMQQPLDVQVSAARLARNGVEIDSAILDLLARDGEAEVRSLKIGGLGGSVAARGRVLRDRDGVFTVAVEPEWSDLDLARIATLLGEDDAGRGILSGRASLESSGMTLAAGLENLNGTFEATLGDGALPGLNVARVTLASLDDVPRLEEAIEGRARERLPELLAQTSAIDLLRVSGTINEGRVQIGELRLDSRQYAIDARGRLSFDGETDLEGTLVLTADASRSLLSGSGVLQALAGSDEQVRIPIAVHGTYPELRSRPSKDYLADAAARAIRLPGRDRAASFLRRLLGQD
jgi:hypothetical protein